MKRSGIVDNDWMTCNARLLHTCVHRCGKGAAHCDFGKRRGCDVQDTIIIDVNV